MSQCSWFVEEQEYETHISTKPFSSQKKTRIPCTHGNSRRSPRISQPPIQGTSSPLRVARLKRRGDFSRVSKTRVVFHCLGVSVRWAPSNHCTRVGFTVSKRHVSHKAVERNRAKRRLRAWADTHLSLLKELEGDFVFIANKHTIVLPYIQLSEQCKEAVLKCFQKGTTLGLIS